MEKTVQMSDFISHALSLLWVKLCYGILLRNVGEQGFKAVHKTVHLITGIYRQRLLNFFSSAHITLISTKDMKYCMVPIRTSQAAQQQKNKCNFGWFVLILSRFSA